MLDDNNINECEMKGHVQIKTLSLNKNKLENLAGFVNLINCERLLLAEN